MEIFNTYTPQNLISSAAAAVQTTFGDLAPIVALVVGISLSFFLIKSIILLFKMVGHYRSMPENKNEKYDFVRYHMSDMEMRHRGIKSDAIAKFPE